jgi:hypothetical protein
MEMSRGMAKTIDGKKFMWDGKEYEKKDAEKTAERYENDGFEVRVVEEEGKYLVYTRRVVKEVKVEKPEGVI